MGVIDRKTYKRIEWYLYNYQELKQSLAEEKDDIIEAGGRDLSEWGGGQSYKSDPTANKAIKLTKKHLMDYEHWLKVIDCTVKKYDKTPLGLLIIKRYFKQMGEVAACRELHIERATYYRWKEEIVIYTAMLALQEGLIKINSIA